MEWVDDHAKGLDEIVTMGRVLPQLINEAGAGNIIINMRWEVLDLNASKIDLLISDRPVIRFQGLKAPDCMIMIPIDRQRLFVASHHDRGFDRFQPEAIARAANNSTAQAACTRVYGTGVHHRPLVEKYLARHDAATA